MPRRARVRETMSSRMVMTRYSFVTATNSCNFDMALPLAIDARAMVLREPSERFELRRTLDRVGLEDHDARESGAVRSDGFADRLKAADESAAHGLLTSRDVPSRRLYLSR